MNKLDDQWWLAIDGATNLSGKFVSTTIEFNLACDHIVELIEDASVMLERGSHSTATFLAITALEETAKVHVGMYRSAGQPIPRGKDPMYKHGKKHLLALGPTVAMGSRLQSAIGETRMNQLIQQAREGLFVRLREESLYLERKDDIFVTPKSIISKLQAREILLLTIEAFDDALVGYTDHTYACSKRTDGIFAMWANWLEEEHRGR